MDKKTIIFGVMVVLLLLVFILLYPFKTKQIEIKDRCGNIGGKVVHTIADESVCRGRCSIDCLKDGEYSSFEHNFKAEVNGCNYCGCTCKKGLVA